ncbi:hypothetical protein GOP47_0014699 [Adiantum capillus-veneris]|uniref:Fucosyltransferase n=1 Tax=Adiantum capillus-veneris TaxID=13818 RepID=A0A9D4UM34_ADICA|nr:hypothetical protein GOP47_0014699 [Adiantum capillus-veneris]
MPARACRRSTIIRRLCSRFPLYLVAFTTLFLCILSFRPNLGEFLYVILHGGFSVSTSISQADALLLNSSFTHLLVAYGEWDAHVGCTLFTQKHPWLLGPNPSLQDPHAVSCASMRLRHVSVLVKEWRWLPDNLDNLYICPCGLTCLWSKSKVIADGADADLYETGNPPRKRKQGDPLRVYMDLEPGRKSPAHKDIFISYHANDTVQATYAGASFHMHRSYFTSPIKKNDILVYWSSSHCVPARSMLAMRLLAQLPHHSFGKCLNNVGGRNALLQMFPHCGSSASDSNYWAYHLHCAMSHYKFVLSIENTMTESYVTEKLFYALDAGAVPIYFGAENVEDFVPPHSIINGLKFASIESLAAYVKEVAADPVLYAQFHAWRRCGVMGSYHQTRAVSLDSLPCRLCAVVSKYGGKALASQEWMLREE